MEESILTRETVANISNLGSKTYISTENRNLADPDPEDGEEQEADEDEVVDNDSEEVEPVKNHKAESVTPQKQKSNFFNEAEVDVEFSKTLETGS